ncbi:probable aminoacyl tRNA synthase complex-interacting multifunctional protein 2 isoform X1 [Bactrocera neohumeralis]|uniref:probable aminoacyl tRNA synthase complex-interacting multifunctional protein 2 isoform X1 n=1 Tax=Bactrocera tryoni TaxID=59916 RepID=UPI001A98E791|nr:probable aminoacyl tRNA synthase complex-interacting multifunctional protein 2 isoform X1 [Bactrocera tryoni]XP_050335009.1 probable aminoacyl tRNA synthase complex-interacting multifunctional protein 2 isoform X1 [Bactrocera neohumeralis]
MYELKTLLPEYDIQLPTCMYPMKVLNNSVASEVIKADACSGFYNSNGNPLATSAVNSLGPKKNVCALDLDNLSAQIQNLLKSSNDFGSVCARQEKVLKQLQDLKQQMANIRASLGLCQKGPQHTGQTSLRNGGLREEPLHDIVINGHPNFIPYALLALKNAWKDLFTIDVRTFKHSTMPDIGKDASEFEKKLAQVKIDPSKPKVKVSLIWKNCEHTEMISSPTMYVPIYGEVNIIRYLGRVGPEEYRYEDLPNCNEIDAVLDICYQLLRCNTSKNRASMLRALNLRLGKQKYFGGDKITIADIGVHSSLKRLPAITSKDLTPTLTEWQKRVQLVTQL